MGLEDKAIAAKAEIQKVLNEAKDVPIEANQTLHDALAKMVLQERAEKQNLEARALKAIADVEGTALRFLNEYKLPLAVVGGALLGAALTWLGFAARWVYG